MSEIDDRPQTISTPPERDAGNLCVQRLKPNAVGPLGVLFMSVATAAPITPMVGNVPIAVGFGNGSAAKSKHITATGAFYGYISHGLGRVVGLSAGVLTALV